ncbi:Heat shock 70 kDa protein 12B [Trichoderma ghanense]|uniref:Heat shock 70 kDa protein 12B n=1 Tax=Trichoderma ghanense TaxID=65468 RepID=A0ABY2HFQ2_9HYPO
MPRPTGTQRGAGRGTRQLHTGDSTIVIGIDFGTTFSGVAWARASRPEQIDIITSWKSHFNFSNDKEKVPTSICYTGEGEAPLWGYAAPVGESTLQWFKLCLLDEEDIPRYLRGSTHLQTAKSSLSKMGNHAVDVISDYLRELWKYSLSCIERAEGASMVELSAFRVVVTLPAIWPAYAQFRMKEAIEKAGILEPRGVSDTTLEFISEPEAAALATLRDMSDRPDMMLGDHFVVCDAGGGTVDVITYTVTNQAPMEIEESVRGDGSLCGATFVDERFRNLLKHKMAWDTWDKLGEDGIARLMNNEWENGIKRQFCNDGSKWTLQIPIISRKRDHDEYSCPTIDITNRDVIDVFTPVMSQIVKLVTAQIQEVKKRYKKQPKFIILVGGFGRCHHLHSCLHDALKSQVNILQSSGARPWTAVCRGAVIRGLETSDSAQESAVRSRIARASYGTMCNVTPWTEDEHDARDKEWCPVTRVFIAADQASWFLRIRLQKGETIQVGKCIEMGFHQDLDKPVDSISTYLIYSNAPIPSDRCDETVKELCQIRWSRVPEFDQLPSWRNSKGQSVKRLSYVIKMTSNGVSLDFEISHEGRVVAAKNVVVDYSESGMAARRSAGHADDDDDSGTYVPPGSGKTQASSRVHPVWGSLTWEEFAARVEGRQGE